MRRNVALLLLMCVLCSNLVAQENNPMTDSLKRKLESASTPKEKITWLGQLTMFYFTVDKKLSDEYAAEMERVAEDSRDRSLMVFAKLSNARRYYNLAGRQDYLNRGIKYSEQALDLAKSSNLDEYEAWSYHYLAMGARFNSENDKALNYGNIALSIATGMNNDSLTVSLYNSLANTYLAKKEKMLSFRNYLLARDVAEHADNYYLMRACYLNIANFYDDIGEYEKSKDFIYKYMALTKRFDKKMDRTDAYNKLGRAYAHGKQYDMAEHYYESALSLADSIHFELIKLNTYGEIVEMYAASDQAEKAMRYFQAKPELAAFLAKAGFQHMIDRAYARAYMDMNKLDSAFYYIKRAQPAFEQFGNKPNLFSYYSTMADLFRKKKDYKSALDYTLRGKQIADDTGDLELLESSAQQLDSTYQKLGDFKLAYQFNRQYQTYKDSLKKLATEKDLMVIEVENEHKRKEREAQLEEQATRDRHNIQYMGITVAIAAVFMLLVVMGIFRVSKGTIRVMGFFAFIFLFEFIILIADNQIHHWTHGEPWKVLLIKIGLISLLLPLHHFLEEKVIHYLTSKKMLELNKEAILSKFSSRKQVETETE